MISKTKKKKKTRARIMMETTFSDVIDHGLPNMTKNPSFPLMALKISPQTGFAPKMHIPRRHRMPLIVHHE